jgi:hypothetical protein
MRLRHRCLMTYTVVSSLVKSQDIQSFFRYIHAAWKFRYTYLQRTSVRLGCQHKVRRIVVCRVGGLYLETTLSNVAFLLSCVTNHLSVGSSCEHVSSLEEFCVTSSAWSKQNIKLLSSGQVPRRWSKLWEILCWLVGPVCCLIHGNSRVWDTGEIIVDRGK